MQTRTLNDSEQLPLGHLRFADRASTSSAYVLKKFSLNIGIAFGRTWGKQTAYVLQRGTSQKNNVEQSCGRDRSSNFTHLLGVLPKSHSYATSLSCLRAAAHKDCSLQQLVKQHRLALHITLLNGTSKLQLALYTTCPA